jgi:O-antigen ligase
MIGGRALRSRILSGLEDWYAYVGVVYYEQGIIQSLRAARGEEALRPGSSDIVSSATQLGILVVLITIMTVRWRQFAPLVRHMGPYVAIILLCIASAAWSDNPLPTMRRSTSLVTCVLFGLYLTRTFGLREAIAMAGRSAVFLGVLSVMMFVLVPSIGRETALGYQEAMRGVFSQKNPMAECMLLGVTCYAFRLLDEGVSQGRLGCIALLLVCIALGRSATSLGIAGLVLLATGFMAARRRPVLSLVMWLIVGWAALAGLTLVVLEPDMVLGLLGRDSTLTGRAPLWQQVLGVIAERPFFGHGYAGFWNDESRAVQYLWLFAGWRAPDSHNGYLDVAVQIGLVGLGLYLALWGLVIWRAIGAARAGTLREARWVLLFMLVNVTLNLDEGPMPFPDEFTLLMPGALVTLGLWHDRQKALRALLRARPLRLQAGR